MERRRLLRTRDVEEFQQGSRHIGGHAHHWDGQSTEDDTFILGLHVRQPIRRYLGFSRVRLAHLGFGTRCRATSGFWNDATLTQDSKQLRGPLCLAGRSERGRMLASARETEVRLCRLFLAPNRGVLGAS